jgi:hypothetical protein
MAVQPSRGPLDVLVGVLAGRPESQPRQTTDRSAKPPARVTPEPAGGYDPRAPRGTYLDILA